MKNIRFILTALLAGLFAVACEEKPIDGLSGTYDNIERYNFTEVKQQPTRKISDGNKVLAINFKDAKGDAMDMRIGSTDWILRAGTYAATETVTADKMFSAVVNGSKKIVSGTLNVNLINDLYIFSGLLTAEDGTEVQCNYRGALTFEIGEDDPSGYTAMLIVSPVNITNQSGQVTGTVPGVSKYAFTISDPDGNNVAMFEMINAENLEAPALAGEYTVKDNAQDALSMASGMQMPAEWGGWSWGSYLVNPKGTKEFLKAGGKISIILAKATGGGHLYTFSGSGLGTTLGMNVDGSFNPGELTETAIKFVTLQQAGN